MGWAPPTLDGDWSPFWGVGCQSQREDVTRGLGGSPVLYSEVSGCEGVEKETPPLLKQISF
jgi:hypothetical protein